MMAPRPLQHSVRPQVVTKGYSVENDFEDANHSSFRSLGLCRSRTLRSLTPSVSSVSTASTLWSRSSSLSSSETEKPGTPNWFSDDVRRATGGRPNAPEFHKSEVRVAIEPHVAEARLRRDQSRQSSHLEVDASIASAVGVPYTSLRSERRFLFDVDCFPMHQVLAKTLGVEDLSLIHKHRVQDRSFLMSPLLQRQLRREFHECYDSFVTSFCIPLLHSWAMTEGIFDSSSSPCPSSKINYRYQAFPSISIVRPGEFSAGPHCDAAKGHSIGSLNFHIPLTAAFGTNALYTESHPGREDWHPLNTKSVGLGYLFDGARCIHFATENTTDRTRVSLDFRVAIYREDRFNGELDGELCTRELLEDHFSLSGPGYYDEVTIDIGVKEICHPGPVVAKKYGDYLLDPDERVGFPFDKA